MATMQPLPQLQPMENPMEQYGRVVALKSMLQQQQMQQQQMAYQQQMQPLQLQQEQQAIQQQALQGKLLQQKVDDDKMLTDMWQKSGGDLDKTWELANAPDSKLSAQGKLGFMQQRYELQKMHNQTSDEEAQLMKHTNEIAGPMLSQMSSASDEDLPKQVATYNSTVAANPSLAKYMPPVPQGLDATGTRNWVKNQLSAHTTYEQLDKDRDYNLKAGPLSNEEAANTNADLLQRMQTIDPNATLPANLTMTPGKSTKVDQKFAGDQVTQMEASATQRMDARYQQEKALDLKGMLPHNSPEYADMMAYEARKKLVPNVMAGVRLQIAREQPLQVIDTDPTTGQKYMRYATRGEMLAANATGNPLVPAEAGQKVMKTESIYKDLYYNIDQVDKSLDAMKTFSAGDRARIAFALRSSDPRSAVATLLTSMAIPDDPKVRNYLTSLASLQENALALRTLGVGGGQTSDLARELIEATVPSGKTPDVGYGKLQLQKFKGTVDRLHEGVPSLGGPGTPPPPGGAPPSGGQPPAGPTPTNRIKIGNDYYNYKGSGSKKDMSNWTKE